MSLMIFNLKNMNEQEKKDVIYYIERMLIAQAAGQHKEICKNWTHGKITEWKFLQEDDYQDRVVAIKYEDGTWFRYYDIDGGTEEMIIKKGIEENE